MTMKESEEIRNEIGRIPVMNDGCANDDNLSIALVSYFENLPECPDDDIDDEVGWSQWAMDKTDDVLDRIAALKLHQVKATCVEEA